MIKRLLTLPPASSGAEAYEQLVRVVNEVEDEHSGTPYDPERWMEDGRIYPPLPDSERESKLPGFNRYVTKGHHVFIGLHGAIGFWNFKTRAWDLTKPGANGQEIPP